MKRPGPGITPAEWVLIAALLAVAALAAVNWRKTDIRRCEDFNEPVILPQSEGPAR